MSGEKSDVERFARLLLAEIILYDKKGVDRAWSQRAIYRMLKRDIDAARQMFLQRYPEKEDVFYGVLVAVLARGDAARLGADYPHPRS